MHIRGGVVMEYIISALIGYIFGCLNTAKIVAKLKGVDIKKVGTNNAGASNVFISVGKIYGVIAAIGDIFKAFFASWIVFTIFNQNYEAAIIAGAMTVIGHIYPFWMKFNGGKGLAALMGVILFIGFKEFAIFGIILIAITLITDYIGLGTLAVAALLPIYMMFFEKQSGIIVAIFAGLAVLIWYKHRENIVRIKNGTEIGFLRKNKTKKS